MQYMFHGHAVYVHRMSHRKICSTQQTHMDGHLDSAWICVIGLVSTNWTQLQRLQLWSKLVAIPTLHLRLNTIVLELVLSLRICLDVVLLFHKGTSVTRHHNGGMDCWVMRASPPPLQTVVHFHVIYLIIFVNCNNIFCVYVYSSVNCYCILSCVHLVLYLLLCSLSFVYVRLLWQGRTAICRLPEGNYKLLLLLTLYNTEMLMVCQQPVLAAKLKT